MADTVIPDSSTDDFHLEPDEIDRLLQSALVPATREETRATSPSNLVETWGSYFLKVALPGVDPAALEIEIVARQVIVRGRYHLTEVENSSDVWRDIPAGPFELAFHLPAEVDGDKAEADYARGILTVRMPKVAHLKPALLKVHADD